MELEITRIYINSWIEQMFSKVLKSIALNYNLNGIAQVSLLAGWGPGGGDE